MKLRLKEDPKEWRKNALLTAGGVATLSTLLRWRRHLSTDAWLTALTVAVLAAICAMAAPQWFRGFYRVSHRVGFHVARALGMVVLSVFFVFVITPMGLVMRALGQDSLRLKGRGGEQSHWRAAGKSSPLDRIF